MTKRTMKYMTKIGQNTGMLKNSKNVHVIAMTIALVAPYLQRENTKLITNSAPVLVNSDKLKFNLQT